MKRRARRPTRKDNLPKKSRQLGVRLTPAQFRAVERAAGKLGIDPATFGRIEVLRATDYDLSQEDAQSPEPPPGPLPEPPPLKLVPKPEPDKETS